MPKVGQSPNVLRPHWTTTDGKTVRLYQGHVLDVLRRLPSKSVHCVVTSPPYWGLRDYGVSNQLGSEKVPDCRQIIEVSPGLYRKGNCAELNWDTGCHVCRMVLVFRELRRVLRDDGTFWLNYGDSYGGGGNSNGTGTSTLNHGKGGSNYEKGVNQKPSGKFNVGLKPGNLVGIPWRVALALQANGWILRQDIIWHKPSPMPESVRNRCTKAHEYVFLFAKKQGYYYDAEAVKEMSSEASIKRMAAGYNTRDRALNSPEQVNHLNQNTEVTDRSVAKLVETGLRNKRSVWSVPSAGYEGAHFATYPPKLIEPMIKAGTSEKGCCSECGAPWKRIVNVGEYTNPNPTKRKAEDDNPHKQGDTGINNVGGGHWPTKTVGWEPTCECNALVIPCTVLDPFIGSGTTCDVSLGSGRRSIGIDLSEKYLNDNAIPRIEGALMSRPNLAALVPREVERMDMGEEL